MRTTALFSSVILLLSACGGTAPGVSGVQRSAEDPESMGARDDEDGKNGGKRLGKRSGGAGRDNGSNGDSPGGESAGSVGSQTARRRPGISTMRDPVGDPEGDGDVPSWVDLAGAVLRDDDGALVATASFTSPLPRRMPDENHVAQVALHLQLPRENAYLYAEGRPEGWKAYFSRKKKATELPPGSFSIEGHEMSWKVPWGSLGDPKRLDWALHLSWTQTTLLRVNYAFDSAPDSGTERLRRR